MKQTHLKGKLPAEVVFRADSRDNVTGQRNTAENRLLSAVWVEVGEGGGRDRWRKREKERGGDGEMFVFGTEKYRSFITAIRTISLSHTHPRERERARGCAA